MQRTVWVCHRKPTHANDEFQKAKEFGKIKVLMEDITGKVCVHRDKKLTKRLMKKLEASSPDDFVLLSGNRIPIALVVSIWMQIHGKINILIFNPKINRYEIRENFGSIEG